MDNDCRILLTNAYKMRLLEIIVYAIGKDLKLNQPIFLLPIAHNDSRSMLTL